MDTAEAFALVSEAWLEMSIRVNYPYTFTWLGRPLIQYPEDLLRLQELIYRVQPDVIVETGVAHGGSLIFLASLCRLIGRGRVIGVDIDIRPHNRAATESHPLKPFITLVQGSSIDPAVVASVKAMIAPDENALVVLDSNHSKAHVRQELEAYAPLLKTGSYVVAMDGHVMEAAAGSSRGAADWATNNPNAAVSEFVREHPDYAAETPPFIFNESVLTEGITGCRGGFVKRIR